MTDIKKTPIPQRLKNVSADHPYVAGAVDIVDDRLGNNQERVNETLQNGINALDSQNYYYAEATDQTSSVTDVLPPSGEADTLYRVASWDGEQYDATVYSEYAWNGEGYQLLDVKQPGIDDEPTNMSTNLVKSGGVSKFKSYNYTKNDYTNSLVKEIHIEGTKSPGMKYYVRSCKRFYSDTTEGSFFYFAVRSHDTIGTAEEETICEFSSGSNIRNSGVYTSTNGDYTVTILVVLDNQADNTGAVSYASYSEGLELNDNCWGDLENAPIISASLRASSIEINNPSAVSSDTVYRNLVKTSANHQIRFYITKFYDAENNEEFMTALARIPLAERFTPCAVLHRNAGLWSMYIYRGNYVNSDVSDTYWLDQGYWTKVLTEADIPLILSNLGENNYTKNSYVNSCIKEIHIEGPKDPSLKYFVRSCLKKGRYEPYETSTNAYFAIQSYDPETQTRVTICEFNEGYLKRRSGVYIDSRTTTSGDSYKTFILLNVTDSDTNDGGIYSAAYSEGLEINDNCWGSYDNAPVIADYIREHNASCKHVDLVMFMGQSNMAGRGKVTVAHPETAPVVYGDIAYEFRAITDPTKLYPVVEPFGVNENNPDGINDGNKKTGSMVSAFCLAYYATCKATIVGVSASVGGTWSGKWLPDAPEGLLPDAIERFQAAVTFLTNNGYIIDHKYMAWCQGETDGDGSTTPEAAAQAAATYKTNFNTIFSAMKNVGIEKCFIVRTGHYNNPGSAVDYSSIINAQSDICRDNEDVIMASTALASFRDKGLMKDEYHYYQDAYNIVGTFAGRNAGLYRKYGICKPQYDCMTESMFFTDKDY